MLKRFSVFTIAVLFSLATCVGSTDAQDSFGLGQTEYVDQNVAVVVGYADATPGISSTLMIELVTNSGDLEIATIDVEDDGSFVLFGSNQLVHAPVSEVVGTLVEPTTGESLGEIIIVVINDFEDWFDKWKHPDLDGVDTVAELPTGRPCLYNYDWLRPGDGGGDHWGDVTMSTGDYFPNWVEYGDNFDVKNKPYIQAVLQQGKPVKDTYSNSDGTIIPATDASSGIFKERKILTDGGYVWDNSIPGWKVPDGHVWDPNATPAPGKWVPPGGNQ